MKAFELCINYNLGNLTKNHLFSKDDELTSLVEPFGGKRTNSGCFLDGKNFPRDIEFIFRTKEKAKEAKTSVNKWAKKNNIQGYSSSIDECEEDET